MARNFLRKWKWLVANQRTRKEEPLHGHPDAALRLELWVRREPGRGLRMLPAYAARLPRMLIARSAPYLSRRFEPWGGTESARSRFLFLLSVLSLEF